MPGRWPSTLGHPCRTASGEFFRVEGWASLTGSRWRSAGCEAAMCPPRQHLAADLSHGLAKATVLRVSNAEMPHVWFMALSTKRRSHTGNPPRTRDQLSFTRLSPPQQGLGVAEAETTDHCAFYSTTNCTGVQPQLDQEEVRTDTTGSEVRSGHDALTRGSGRRIMSDPLARSIGPANRPALPAQRAVVGSARPGIGRWSVTASAPVRGRSGPPPGPRR